MQSHDIYHYVEKCRSRKVKLQDFYEFDFIFAKDNLNMRNLKELCPTDTTSKLLMLGCYDNDPSSNGVIVDPYGSPYPDEYERVYDQCSRACRRFIDLLCA
ncbi:low molecular weight phosphotyrosine protein phosphatase 2-like [Ciona intestinalis]